MNQNAPEIVERTGAHPLTEVYASPTFRRKWKIHFENAWRPNRGKHSNRKLRINRIRTEERP